MSPQKTAPAWRRHVLEDGESAGDPWITVAPENVHATLSALKDDGYRGYVFVTCVDHLSTPVVPEPPGRFEVVYQLRNLETLKSIRVRAFLPGDDPHIRTVSDIFAPANWDERETWDLFGIRFDGHPDLTRILMPDDWEGHPLRRDYPVGGETVDFTSDHEAWQTAPEEA